jgi:hypothetical protein
MEQMNSQFSAGFISNKFRIAKFDPHAKYPLQTHVEFLTQEDFANGIRNPPVAVPKYDKNGNSNGTTWEPRGAYWLKQVNRAEHNAVTFQPGAPAIIKVERDKRIHRVINTFSGFAVRPDHRNSEAKCAKYLAHIRENVAGGDEAASEYFIDWMASGVQHPEDPGRSSPSLRGVPGGGKGVAVLTYGRLFGCHFLHATQREHVVGKFNKHQAEVCLIFVDEALYAEIAADTQILKTLTSETTKQLERKGIDIVTIDNYARLVFATNDQHPIQIESDDRRYPAYLVIEHVSFRCEKDKVKKANLRRAYFQPILQERENGGYEALLGFLLDRDIRNFNPEAIPETAERQMQQLLSAPAGDKMIIEFALDGYLPGTALEKPWLARSRKDDAPYASAGLYDAMRGRGGSKLARESDNMLSGILRGWGFEKKHLKTGNAWAAPALPDLRAKIKDKYPAVEFDSRTEWGVEANNETLRTIADPPPPVSTGLAPEAQKTSPAADEAKAKAEAKAKNEAKAKASQELAKRLAEQRAENEAQVKNLLATMLTNGDRRAAEVEAKAAEVGIGAQTVWEECRQSGVGFELREEVWWLSLPRYRDEPAEPAGPTGTVPTGPRPYFAGVTGLTGPTGGAIH